MAGINSKESYMSKDYESSTGIPFEYLGELSKSGWRRQVLRSPFNSMTNQYEAEYSPDTEFLNVTTNGRTMSTYFRKAVNVNGRIMYRLMRDGSSIPGIGEKEMDEKQINEHIRNELIKERNMEQAQGPEKPASVVIRVSKAGGEVQAYFPDSAERSRATGKAVMTGYAHDGQHFEADIDFIKEETLPLFGKEGTDNLAQNIADAENLLDELRAAGYKRIESQKDFDWNEIGRRLGHANQKEKDMENTKKEITAKELQSYIDSLRSKRPSRWAEAVKEDAVALVGNYIEWHGEDAIFKAENTKDLLNGAKDWKQYSEGGMALVTNHDIARHYCTPSELKQLGFEEGGYVREQPNAKESWLDVQARALFQASELIKKSVRDMEIKRGQGVEQKSPAKAKTRDDGFGMER